MNKIFFINKGIDHFYTVANHTIRVIVKKLNFSTFFSNVSSNFLKRVACHNFGHPTQSSDIYLPKNYLLTVLIGMINLKCLLLSNVNLIIFVACLQHRQNLSLVRNSIILNLRSVPEFRSHYHYTKEANYSDLNLCINH